MGRIPVGSNVFPPACRSMASFLTLVSLCFIKFKLISNVLNDLDTISFLNSRGLLGFPCS